MNGNLLIWGTSFVTCVLLSYGIMVAYGDRRKLRKRMEDPRATGQPIAVLRDDGSTDTFKTQILNWLSVSGQWVLKDKDETSKVRALLVNGGFRHPSAPAILYGLKAVSALLLPIPYVLYSVMHENFDLSKILIAFVFAGIGYFLPQFILQKIVNARQERIDKALPDVIDLFIICMEAGLSLQATIIRVAEEIRDVCHDFYDELQITGGEMRTGLPRDVALTNLAKRTGVQSVQSLVTLMIQSEKLGTSIAQSLRVHADFTRTQRALKAEENAAKLPVKILIPLLFFIFPAMFIVIIGPGAINIMKNLFPALGG